MTVDPARPAAGGPAPGADGEERRSPAVVVLSDQALIADAVAAALVEAGVEAFSVGDRAWQASVVRAHKGLAASVGIALLEVEATEAVAAARRLMAGEPALSWIVLTGAPEGRLWEDMVRAGAARVMERTTGLGTLLAAIQEVDDEATRPAPANPAEATRAERSDPSFADLTTAEREVLEGLYAGQGVAEIAAARGVTVATARHQVRAILRKMGVRSQLAAVARYAELRDRPGGRAPSDRLPS